MCSVLHKNVTEFRCAVTTESDRLTSLCSTWRAVIEEDAARPNKALTEDIIGDINVAIGQAELLKKQRFHQFNGLIDNCEFKTGEKLTTVQDLQGFWDIIYIQVDDISNKFISLDKLRSNNWKEQQQQRPPLAPVKRPLVPVKKAVAPKGSAASSSIRAHILAARNRLNKLALDDSAPAPPQPSAVLQASSNAVITVTRSTPTKARPAPCDKENIDTRGSTPTKSVVKARGARTPKGCGVADEPQQQASDDDTPSDTGSPQGSTSPQLSTFDAGFFKIQTPCKTRMPRKEMPKQNKTPIRSKSDHGETRVLASAMLKERVLRTPVAHKDYSPCMRITRSMKKRTLRHTSPERSPQ